MSSMVSLHDQMGRALNLTKTPTRIISLVPSQTELLYDLGLNDEVVGITKFCVHPDHWFKTKVRVGGTKRADLKKIFELRPDLVIANKEENTQEDIDAISQRIPVYVSDIKDLNTAIKMISDLGTLCYKGNLAEKLIISLREGFHLLRTATQNFNQGSPPRVLYLIWKDPFMAAGTDTFINAMLEESGFLNALPKSMVRYPNITKEEIESLQPDYIFLSSEPFPFKGRHADELRRLFPKLTLIEVDGEAYSWYGSRLLQSLKYFEELQAKIKQINNI